jgi:hypothetical protein
VISSRDQLKSILLPTPESVAKATRELTEVIPDVFLADLESRRVVHYSPIVT